MFIIFLLLLLFFSICVISIDIILISMLLSVYFFVWFFFILGSVGVIRFVEKLFFVNLCNDNLGIFFGYVFLKE